MKMADKCKTCSNKVSRSDKGIQCEICDKWWHAKCVKLSDEKYELMSDELIHWYCSNCNGAASKLRKELIQIKKKQDELENKLKNFEKCVVKKEEVGQIVKEAIQREIDDPGSRLMSSIEEKVKEERYDPVEGASAAKTSDFETAKKFRELMQEFDEAEKRKRNLIVHKLSEENEASIKDNLAEIFQVIDDGFTTSSIKSCKRLVKKDATAKPRPLLVTLTERLADSLITNARKLKNSGHKISLSRDLPKQTRNYREQLIQHAKNEKGDKADDFLFRIVGRMG